MSNPTRRNWHSENSKQLNKIITLSCASPGTLTDFYEVQSGLLTEVLIQLSAVVPPKNFEKAISQAMSTVIRPRSWESLFRRSNLQVATRIEGAFREMAREFMAVGA